MNNLVNKQISEVLNQFDSGVNALREEIGKKLKLIGECFSVPKIKVGIGDTFKVAGIEWKVLDITESGYICLAMERYRENRKFDSSCNNWNSSDLRDELNTTFLEKLEEELGEDSIVEFERNLLSMDGQTEFGTCMDKVSLINVDEYRKYRKYIPNTGDYWWWTLTPDSTPCNDDLRWVRVVSPSGFICSNYCNCNRGVRPFCIFSSSLFESDGE